MLRGAKSAGKIRLFVELRLRFVLLDGSLTGPAFVSALSDHDLFVETDRPLPLRTRTRMRLYMPGHPSVDLTGEVRRHGEGTMTQGMSIEFTPDAAALAVIEEYLYRPKGLRRAPPGYAPQPPAPAPPEPAAVVPAAAEPAIDSLVSKYLDELAPALDPRGFRLRPFEPNDAGNRPLARVLSAHLSLPAAELEEAAREAEKDWPPLPDGALVEEGPEIGERFAPDALRLFQTMQSSKLEFLETLDSAAVRALLDGDSTRTSLAPEPAKVPAPFEVCDPALFDPGPPAKPVTDGEAERLKKKYNFDDSIFDVEALKNKYRISEDLFADDEEAKPEPPKPPVVTVAPPWQAARGPTSNPDILVRIGDSQEQRSACAQELKKRGQDAFARGLIVKAAADLGLALAFDPSDVDLRMLHEEVREMANITRAEELYNQGLQQKALGEIAAASESLLTAARMHPDRKYVLAAIKMLLGTGTADAVKHARGLLAAELEKEPENIDLLLLQGRAAEIVSYAKGAQIYYRTVLKIDPDNRHAKDGLARVENS